MSEIVCTNCDIIFNSDKYISTCPKCTAAMQRADAVRQLNRDTYRLGGPKAYFGFTLEKYDNKRAIDACAEYPACNLFIWGPAGTGKTHLATALVRRFPTAVIVRPQTIHRDSLNRPNPGDEINVITRYARMDYLVIDDLGVDKKTDYSYSCLYEIIDMRDMELRNGLIVTSNLSLPDLADRMGDDRVTSRLAGLCKVIELTGNDRRIKGRNE